MENDDQLRVTPPPEDRMLKHGEKRRVIFAYIVTALVSLPLLPFVAAGVKSYLASMQMLSFQALTFLFLSVWLIFIAVFIAIVQLTFFKDFLASTYKEKQNMFFISFGCALNGLLLAWFFS